MLVKEGLRRLEVDEADDALLLQRVPVADRYLLTCFRRGDRDADGAISEVLSYIRLAVYVREHSCVLLNVGGIIQ